MRSLMVVGGQAQGLPLMGRNWILCYVCYPSERISMLGLLVASEIGGHGLGTSVHMHRYCFVMC